MKQCSWDSSSSITLIAGPCSAESYEQVYATAQGLQNLNIDLFRAGLWKPRTQPGCFEGVGSVGLHWLQQVQKDFGYKVATEVCLPEHAQLALEAGVDVLWLGARTVSNPYAVQGIAEVLRSVNVPVLVKNPISPDLSLWVGAIERLQKAGLSDIGAVFRGFSTYPTERPLYRNVPYWSIVFELKRIFPHIPIICDPSHITGQRNAVAAMCQKAIDLGFDMLMVECHVEPEKALSDAKQQVTPKELGIIMQALSPRNVSFSEDEQLNHYRILLSEIDEHLLSILAHRMTISKEIGNYKQLAQIPILQAEQFASILQERSAWGENMGLQREFVEHIMSIVHEESVRVQSEENNKQSFHINDK